VEDVPSVDLSGLVEEVTRDFHAPVWPDAREVLVSRALSNESVIEKELAQGKIDEEGLRASILKVLVDADDVSKNTSYVRDAPNGIDYDHMELSLEGNCRIFPWWC
jgi:hypothetical protein